MTISFLIGMIFGSIAVQIYYHYRSRRIVQKRNEMFSKLFATSVFDDNEWRKTVN